MPILTAKVGTNADLFPDVLDLYVRDGAKVVDLTYGKGVFWRNVNRARFQLITCDLETKADIRCDLRQSPFYQSSVDVVVLDPPYMHGGKTVKASINDCYRNANGNHKSIIDLYAAGLNEGKRLLVIRGILIVKCQDETESGKQMLSHIEVIQIAVGLGFRVLDLFVLVQPSVPAMRVSYQKSARKNHSYFIVFQRGVR